MITTTTDDELQGDNQNTRLESFSKCKHASENQKSKYPYVDHRCKFADCYNRCTRDTCVFDKDESPDVCNKHWVHCLLCDDPMSIDPKQMDVPICDRCRSVLRQCMKLPFTCAKCGASQSHVSKFPFSRLCDSCIEDLLWCENCKHWTPIRSTSIADFDLP